jgi:hypothetical protein
LKSVAPIVVEKASGAVVTDTEGRQYLDCFAGIAVVYAGHCNPEELAAAKAQMDKLVNCSSYLYHVRPTADLAERIAQITPPGLTKSFFGSSGADRRKRHQVPAAADHYKAADRRGHRHLLQNAPLFECLSLRALELNKLKDSEAQRPCWPCSTLVI